HGEEPVLSGTRGSGTIFFGNCTMRCVFCQNYQISQDWKAQMANEIGVQALARHMLYLQESGCHNINLVSPTHFVPQIVKALLEAVPKGLRLPLVYNTSGYESVEVLRELEDIIDIYLPDLRYAAEEPARKFSGTPDYPHYARAAIKEMYRQVGELVTDDMGVAQRGVIVRHLILPNGLAGSKESLTWLANEVSPAVTVSIMSQYYPAWRAFDFPGLDRKITPAEYREVVELVYKLGLENGWLQGMDAANSYRPDFERNGHPFDHTQEKSLDSTTVTG
ncbi:MAG: radical SAM protein, partial [Chloroflexi bacterium]|nr:radical SAM protein [Chloroflexota bacterium]